LYGFGTDDAHIQIAEPSGCSACYVVKFNPDGSFSGKTTSNDFVGIYSTGNKSFKIVEYGTTQVGEVGDGYRFVDAFRSSVKYEIANGKLKLYYNNNDFLLFNPQ
jgi:heat shock protein HslJ